jgi:hypothetical protein
MAYVCCYKSVKIMWEYKEFTINTKNYGEPIKTLNELGKEGWELLYFSTTALLFYI